MNITDLLKVTPKGGLTACFPFIHLHQLESIVLPSYVSTVCVPAKLPVYISPHEFQWKTHSTCLPRLNVMETGRMHQSSDILRQDQWAMTLKLPHILTGRSNKQTLLSSTNPTWPPLQPVWSTKDTPMCQCVPINSDWQKYTRLYQTTLKSVWNRIFLKTSICIV